MLRTKKWHRDELLLCAKAPPWPRPRGFPRDIRAFMERKTNDTLKEELSMRRDECPLVFLVKDTAVRGRLPVAARGGGGGATNNGWRARAPQGQNSSSLM